MSAAEIEAFLTDLAVLKQVAGSLSGGAADQSSVESEKGSLDQQEQTEAEKLGERFHHRI